MKKNILVSEKITPKCGRFHSPPGAILLSFCNFPHTLGTLGCVENCKNSVKLHQVGSGSGHVILILEPGFDNIAFQSPKKSQLSGRQTLTRKKFPDEVRKFVPPHLCQKCVNPFRDIYKSAFIVFTTYTKVRKSFQTV